MSRYGIAATLLGLACAALGCGSLDTPDRVHDLRLLAMRADPPQQVFYLPLQQLESSAGSISGAGGLSGYGGGGGPKRGTANTGTTGGSPGTTSGTSNGGGSNTSGMGGGATTGLSLPVIQPITTTALIADPPLTDGGAIHYQFATCTSLDSNTDQCLESSPDYQVIGEGDFVSPGDEGWGEVSATFTPSYDFLIDAINDDAYHGFGGLPIVVQITISAGGVSVVGIKRSTLLAWSSMPLPPADMNPVIPAVTLAGQVWPDGELPWLADPNVEFDVVPQVVPGLEVSYPVPTFEGSTLTFQESWNYSFFCTAGSFSPGFSGGVDAAGDVNPVNTTWLPPDTNSPEQVTYWIVVEDGRGGESWVVRRALWAPESDGGN